jgi:hypothetical protein
VLEDFKVRGGQVRSGKSCRHYRKAVKIIGDRLDGGETAEQIQAMQVSGLGEKPGYCLQAIKQELSARGTFAMPLADLFKG